MQKNAFIKDSLTMAIIQIDGCPDLLSHNKLPPKCKKHAFIKDSLTMAIIQIDGCPDLF